MSVFRLAATIVIASVIGPQPLAVNAQVPGGPSSLRNISVSVSKSEKVLDLSEAVVPSARLDNFPDSQFFTYRVGQTLFGVLVNGQNNLRLEDPLAAVLRPASGGVASVRMAGLEPGPDRFDQRGVWLQSAFPGSGDLLYGFYHAEAPLPPGDCVLGHRAPYECSHCAPVPMRAGRCVERPQACGPATGRPCMPNALLPHQLAAYAESHDGGMTWTKPGYPQNQIITGQPDYAQAGDFDFIQVGTYIYTYYTGIMTYLARSALADGGRPGTWWKYWCPSGRVEGPDCGFTQPGIGGLSTAIPGLDPGAYVSHNTYIGRYISIDNSLQRYTVNLKVSADGIQWRNLSANPPPATTPPPGFRDIHPSIIDSATGDSQNSGQTFWIYAVRMDETFMRHRSLIRMLVTLSKG